MMFDLALKIFLFLAPIIYWRNLPLAQVQLQFFQLGTIFLFLVALSQKKQRDFRDKSLFGLGIICFLNVFISQTPYSKMALTNILFALLLYYLIVCYTKNIRCIFGILIGLSVINVLLALSQRLGFDFVFDTSANACGLMGTTAFHGDLQALVLPLAVYLHPLLAVFPLAGLVLSKSITASVAVFAGLVFFLVKKKFGPIYFLALFTAMAVFIIRFQDLILEKIRMRFMIWARALELMFERPLEGWGFGSIMGFAKELTWPQYGTADRLYNDPLEFGLCTGVVGLIFLFMFSCNKLKRYRRSSKSLLLNTVFGSCLIASIICLSHSPMAPLFSSIGQSPRIAIVIITMFALLEILLQREGGEGC